MGWEDDIRSLWGRFQHWLWNGFLGPNNKKRFKLRIYIRVQWIRLKLWWKHLPLLSILWDWMKRPFWVALAFSIPFFIMWFLGEPISGIYERLTSLLAGEGDTISWNAALILLGAPVAFILWAFRDRNAKINLENQRKDINLKEFQEIQMRAAGAMDEKFSTQAIQTLQIAAIHQLRPFLRGEYGKAFRRPAWEMLKARLATSAQETGFEAISDWVEKGGFKAEQNETASKLAERNVHEIRSKIRQITSPVVTLAERALIEEEAALIFRPDLPLSGGRFGGMNLTGALLSHLNLSRSSFMKANLMRAHLEGAYLRGAHLEGANLIQAHLEGADLSDAHLEGARLYGTHLEGAYLMWAHFESADLSFAHLEGAYLIQAHLERAHLREAHLERADLRSAYLEGAYIDTNTDLNRAIYDDETQFADDWQKLSNAQKDEARKPWRDRGMIHADEKNRKSTSRAPQLNNGFYHYAIVLACLIAALDQFTPHNGH